MTSVLRRFLATHAMMSADPRKGMYLACALLLRGPVGMGDVARNLARIKPGLRMAHWNPDGFKVRLMWLRVLLQIVRHAFSLLATFTFSFSSVYLDSCFSLFSYLFVRTAFA